MSLRILLAASAVLAFAAPALAQETPAAPPAAQAPQTAEAVDPGEAALEARGEAFGTRMQAMAGEMQAAIAASGGDQARADASLDAIVARYQPEADALADEFQTFLTTRAAASTDEQEKAEVAAALPAMTANIRGVPAMVRVKVQEAVAAAAAGAAAPTPTPAPAE